MTAPPSQSAKPRIAVPFGDPSGIGPEIAIKAALDPEIRRRAHVSLIADRSVIDDTCDRLGCGDEISALSESGEIGIDPVDALDGPAEPGVVSAESGRAMVGYARHAIGRAMQGAADAVVAAPHNQTAAAKAGIPFDGYPGLLARETGIAEDKVFLMLVSPEFRIAHVTLHMALRAALDAITTERVLDAARATNRALVTIGIEAPRIAVCGINPHAGEGGLFGDEDDRIVRPAVEAAREEGLTVDGPAGADLLLAEGRHDAYLAMFHDQGHIPVKLAGRNRSFGILIGAPILFSTVAHGSAHDIAGSGTADPSALAGTIVKMSEFLDGKRRKQNNIPPVAKPGEQSQ